MLELRNIGFEVEDSKEILHDVNLTIDDRFVAITGPNGGGKSTLAKIIAGINTPTSGQILLDGEDITGLSVSERAKKGISYAFQQPVRFKGLRVRDLMALASGIAGPEAAFKAWASKLPNLMELVDGDEQLRDYHFLFTNMAKSSPYLLPGMGEILLILCGSLLLSAACGPLASAHAARKISRAETYHTMREGE